MINLLKALNNAWVKSVSAFPFLELAGEEREVKEIDIEKIKYLAPPGSVKWLNFFDWLLGGRGGIIWSGNWDQGKVPFEAENLKKNPEGIKKITFPEDKPLTVIVDREGELLLLKGQDILRENYIRKKRKAKIRIAFYHSDWVEKAEKENNK